jgi:hypothetical protein
MFKRMSLCYVRTFKGGFSMRRMLVVLILAASGLAACAWPPKPSVPSAGNPAEPVAETAGGAVGAVPDVAVPRVAAPELRAPRMSPMTMPRIGSTGGGLLRR